MIHLSLLVVPLGPLRHQVNRPPPQLSTNRRPNHPGCDGAVFRSAQSISVASTSARGCPFGCRTAGP